MKPELHDDLIERELRRRASGEWQPERVLPAVRRGMERRRERGSAAPRWAALVALIGLLGVVAVLALALPRLPGGPSAASPPTTGGGLVVLSPADFAAQLESGELNGLTVLVEGRVEPVVYDHDVQKAPPPCAPSDHDECLDALGTLAGAEHVQVRKRWVAVPASEASVRGGPRDGWQWWDSPQAPVEGMLLLSADDSGRVVYEGRAHWTAADLTAGAAEAAALDPTTLALDQIVLVEGWLTQAGSEPPSCAPPDPGTYLPELQQKYCGNPAWIAAEPATLDPDGFLAPKNAVHVQFGGYTAFAADPAVDDAGLLVPRAGTYALARRLYGGGCPDNAPPCWDWQIVARVSTIMTAQPTSLPGGPYGEDRSGDFVLTLSAAEPFYAPGEPIDVDATLTYDGPQDDVQLSGVTHLIHAFGARQLDGPLAMGPGWDEPCLPHELRRNEPIRASYRKSASWGEGDPHADFYRRWSQEQELTLPAGHWELTAYSEFAVGPECSRDQVVLEASIRLRVGDGRPSASPSELAMTPSAPVSPSASATLAAPSASPSEVPSATPTDAASPQPTPTTVTCTGAPAQPENGAVWVVDRTGSVRGCEVGVAEPEDSGITGAIDPPSLTLTWTIPCVSDVQLMRLDFWHRSPTGEEASSRGRLPYLLSMTRMPPTDTSAGCLTAISGRQITLLLDAPIDASDVDLVVTNEGRALDRVEQAAGDFQFELESGQLTYEQGEPLDVTASLTFERPGPSIPISGLAVGIGLEQLDGPLELEPAPSILMCANSELEAGVPLVIEYRASEGWPAGHPDADFFEQYTRDGQFVLPPGTYLIYASASFAIGPGCTGDNVELNTAIVVTVR